MGTARLSIAGVAGAAFWFIAVLGAAMLPMTDPDTWWHIRVGREILETGSIPRTDEWSIAGAGRPWVSQDWASNVLMAMLHGAGTWGPTLVSFTYGLMAVGSVALLWDAIGVRNRGIGWLARSAWLLVGLVLAAPVLGARVQVVDLLLGAATLNILWRHLSARQTWHLVALPGIALAWVNLHAGFPLLFLLGGAVVVGELAERWLRRSTRTVPLTGSALGWLIVSLLASAAVLLVNPNGGAIYTYPFETLGIGALPSFVGEWQPARLTAPAGQLLAVFVVAALLPALTLGRSWLRIGDGLILVGMTFMAVTAVRFLLVAGPIGSAIACVALAPFISGLPAGRSAASLIRRSSRVPAGGRGLVNGALAIAIAIGGISLAIGRVSPTQQERAVADQYPVGAVDWLVEHDVGDRIFNRYEWGGYVGLRRPDQPIFIDGRADVYGDEVIRAYVETISVNQDPGAYLDAYRVDHVLYPADATLGRWLTESGEWRVAYEDEVASVWVRD